MDFSKLAKQYVSEIQSGKINACKTIKQAINRHVTDLEKSKSLEFPYVFSEKYGKAALMAVRLNHRSVAMFYYLVDLWVACSGSIKGSEVS
jgi:phage terminase large subunit-like protein